MQGPVPVGGRAGGPADRLALSVPPLHLVERDTGSFQESVSASDIVAMGRRAFGGDTVVTAVHELAGGLYNNTYRVELRDRAPVVLRVAPRAHRQARIERAMLRNEHAALPFLAPIAALMPRTLHADWTHEIIPRDHVWQTLLDGVPATEGLHAYPRGAWRPFYRQLGTITAAVHGVRGERFGPVAGPGFATWSQAVVALLEDTAADLVDAELDAADVAKVLEVVTGHSAVLDEIRVPRLLHGDLWTPNVMLAPGAPEPTIIGVLDHERASWGDPAADWGIATATGEPRAAFLETYGETPGTPSAAWRALVYQAVHLGAVRLERHRLRRFTKIAATYDGMRAVLTRL